MYSFAILADQFGASPVKVDNFWEFLNQNMGGMFLGLIVFTMIFGFFIMPYISDWMMKDK